MATPAVNENEDVNKPIDFSLLNSISKHSLEFCRVVYRLRHPSKCKPSDGCPIQPLNEHVVSVTTMSGFKILKFNPRVIIHIEKLSKTASPNVLCCKDYNYRETADQPSNQLRSQQGYHGTMGITWLFYPTVVRGLKILFFARHAQRHIV
jgi:hypothetical protein